MSTTDMAHAVVGDVVVTVHTATAPSDAEWNAWMNAVRSIPIDRLRVLVFTDGGAPTTLQRAGMTDYFNERKVPM